ncbi:(2Fe-2S)-binding protein [Litorivivens sp.]|uniref:(2Fe-2S)-binding protein n=1 Tax=Litorivivens sp. TaxID=2020868 RepID=UPI0035634B81
MAVTTFTLNGQQQRLDVEPDTPLLWVIREACELTGTKFGCGRGLCGACTVHLDGYPVRSCSFPVSLAEGKTITTIEGIAPSEEELHPVQQVWMEQSVPQCGYCQSGQIMAAVALLKQNPEPSDDAIDSAMSNICRCGTYPRIRTAVKEAAQRIQSASMVTIVEPQEAAL